MKEKFKQYLEEQFRTIRPTLAAMQYRQETLTNLMDRVQELKIKGIEDEDLIYDMCIEELGDFAETLKAFDEKEIKTDEVKRKVSLGAIISVAVMAILTATYLIVGLTTDMWHPGWLIMVGGIFAGLFVLAGFAVPKLAKNKKYPVVRVIIAGCEVLLSVFAFLVLQIIAKLDGSYLTFLAMVPVLLGVDTAIAYATNSKIRHFELPLFVEIFCVMLFVILNLATGYATGTESAIWHPTWVLCLGGVIFAIGEAVFFVAKHNKAKASEEGEKVEKKYKKEDESYYTTWQD